MVHYYDQIKNFGSPNSLCSSITESKHIPAVKRPWRWSSKHLALQQMLKFNECLDKLAAARVDFTAHGMLRDLCLIQAIKTTLDHSEENPTSRDASDSDNASSNTSDGSRFFNPDYTSAQTSTISGFDDSNTCDLETTTSETHSPSGAGMYASDINDDHPPAPHPLLPTLLNSDDDDCGPIELGPLMNEVWFVSRKGWRFLYRAPHKTSHHLQLPHENTPHHLMSLVSRSGNITSLTLLTSSCSINSTQRRLLNPTNWLSLYAPGSGVRKFLFITPPLRRSVPQATHPVLEGCITRSFDLPRFG